MITERSDMRLRSGFTTGSCAAAASRAALEMLVTGKEIASVRITTPKGIPYNAEITDIVFAPDNKSVSCAVIKDGGDDPDVTTGSKICAAVRLTDDTDIVIKGGKGVGKVTKAGLDQPVGEAAINSVPRKMISENIAAVLSENKIHRGAEVTISVSNGEELAASTFNPRLGIVGGISILGTTGIVEPMSNEAILGTIRAQLNIKKAEGREIILAAPGNYGLGFLEEIYGIKEEQVLICSNFIYDTLRFALDRGFKKILLAGHSGKLVKVAGGMKNTHSVYGDHRMEILGNLCRECMDNVSFCDIRQKLSDCVMTDEAVRLIRETGYADKVFSLMAERIKYNMQKWAEEKLQAEVVVFLNENTELTATEYAHEWLRGI